MNKWDKTTVGGVEVRVNSNHALWLNYTKAARDYTFYEKVIRDAHKPKRGEK